MSNQIAEQPSDSSKTAPPQRGLRDGAVEKVEIVRRDRSDAEVASRGNQDYQGVGVFPEQQETVISKQPPVAARSSSAGPLNALTASTPNELGRLLAGGRLEHFQLEEFVGGGGMGAVFRATDMKLDRTVALKVLSRDRTDPDTLRRFQNEAQSAARLDHENIARVHYVGEDQGLHFIVFEFIEGTNIRDLVDIKGALSVGEAINYVLQVAEALEHASQRSVVHRDIKPSNILITAEGRAKLVDMGLARLRHLESESGDLTASGVTLGTFDYISPEQARDPRIADVRSDLYSLGCTFYFMLTGRPPFPEGTVLQKLLSHSSEEPSDPRHLRPDLDDQIVRIISKLLAKQPAERHQQPSELIGELLLLADRLNLPGIAHNGAVWTTPRKSLLSKVERVLPWLLPLVALPLLVFGLDRIWGPSKPSLTENRVADFRPVLPLAAPGAAGSLADTESTRNDSPQTVVPDGGSNEATFTDAADASTAETGEDATRATAPPDPSQDETGQETTGPPVPSPAMEPSEGSGDPVGDAPEDDPTARDSTASGASVEGDTSSSTAQPPTVRKIIVGPTVETVPADALVLNSLASACLEAAVRGIETIELHFNETRQERPFDIASQRLTIRGGDGFRPSVVFRPTAGDLALNRHMIRIGGGQVDWQRIDLRLELPAEPADDWSLFDLQDIESLNVADSVLTVRNVSTDGAQFQDQVAFFQVRPGRMPRANESLDSGETPIPPYIGLSNCIARGQGTLAWAPEATPFRIVCRHCLLVVSERLIDVGGRPTAPDMLDGPVDAVLKNVTVSVGKGVFRMSSSDSAPFQLDLVTDCRDSIFSFTDSNTAFIERRGVADIADLERHLFARGRDNFYVGTTNLLRINPSGDPNSYVDFNFQQRQEMWSQEQNPRFTLLWASQPSQGRTEDRQTAADFLLDKTGQNPAIYNGGESQAGVDAELLPTEPENALRRGEAPAEQRQPEST